MGENSGDFVMPSPFPGMDPYLESPDIWPDVHHSLAGEIRSVLNQLMPGRYYARVEMRPEVGIVEEEGATRRIIPDVAIVRQPRKGSGGEAAVLEAARTELSQFYEFTFRDEPMEHQFVEVRDAAQGHKLVTLIEIVSPSNKRRGPDRDSYRQKQREVLASDASLIEIDLLRGGQRLFDEPGMELFLARLQPRPEYVVLVNRAWRRGEASRGYQVFPAALRDPLPCFPVPLREGETEIPLDLQFLLNRIYDEGPYRRGAVNYAQSPDPPLDAEDMAWATELLQAAGMA
jgi:hypothetical protein